MNEEEAKQEDAKSIKKTVIIICVACIIAIIVIGFAYIKLRDDVDRQEQAKTGFLRVVAYCNDAWFKSENAHDNYTNNPIAMSLFSNVTTTYPFLVAQSRILFTDVDVLINNLTVPNYYVALKQYFLCKIINEAYEHNITEYSIVLKDKNFTGMDYNRYGDVIYFNHEPPTSTYKMGNDGYWVHNYTKTLEGIALKLDFASGVLDIIYAGGK
jgi:hypothetical protein